MLSAPTDPKESFRSNIIFSTDRMRQGEAFPTYVDRQLIELARTLKRFALRRRSTLTVGGVEAIQFVVGWVGSQGAVEQWITMLPREGAVRTITATAAKGGAEAMQAVIDELLTSMAIASPDPG